MRKRYYTIDPVHKDVFFQWQAQSGHTITSARQQRVIAALMQAGRTGITSRELAKVHSKNDVSGVANWGGAFNFLHKAGHIDKLAARREGYGVYVLPQHVGGRDVVLPYRHGGHCPGCAC